MDSIDEAEDKVRRIMKKNSSRSTQMKKWSSSLRNGRSLFIANTINHNTTSSSQNDTTRWRKKMASIRLRTFTTLMQIRDQGVVRLRIPNITNEITKTLQYTYLEVIENKRENTTIKGLRTKRNSLGKDELRSYCSGFLAMCSSITTSKIEEKEHNRIS